MSRYNVPLKPGSRYLRAEAGWDRPLSTFFVQIFVKDADEELALVWEGYSPGQLPNPSDALRILNEYCDVPPDLAGNLEIDRLGTLATADTPFQAAMKERFLK